MVEGEERCGEGVWGQRLAPHSNNRCQHEGSSFGFLLQKVVNH